MAKRKSSENVGGATFADLYDAHEELSQRTQKPIGRPKKKVARKAYTVYLTKEEAITLRRLELMISEYTSLNRSEIVGVAIEILAELMNDDEAEDQTLLDGVRNLDMVKRRLKDVVMS